MRKTERQSQQAKKPSNRPVKPAGSSASNKNRIVKAVKSNNKPPADAKLKARKAKSRKEQNKKLSNSEADDPVNSYKKRLENFQQYMEDKLEEIMTSDKIQKPDADRIIKKFHSAMIQERNSMQKIIDTYSNQFNNSQLNVGSEENNEEDRKIEDEFQQLDDIIKQKNSPAGQDEPPKHENNKGNELKKKTIKKNKIQRITRSRTTKTNPIYPRSTRSMKKNLTTQTDSTQPDDFTKLEGIMKDKNNEESLLREKNEYILKLANLRKEISLDNKTNFTKNEKLLKDLKNPTTDESSASDVPLNSTIEAKQKVGIRKRNEMANRKNEHFRNKKSIEEKDRHHVLMNLLGEENIRRSYMQVNKQGRKKTPIFR